MTVAQIKYYYFPVLLSLVIVFFSMHILKPLAIRINLVDIPGGRKQHQGNIPLIGGIAMFLGFCFAVLTLPMSLEFYRAFLASAALLVIVGVLDDMHELSAKSRLVAQIIAAILMTVWGANYVSNLGNLFFIGDIRLGIWGIPFTIFATVGVINAVNMIDGIDGLAGSLVFVEFILLAILAFLDQRFSDSYLLLILIAVTLSYLILNFPFPGLRKRARVFMGDAGSMFLGFSLAWFLVSLSQGHHPAANPVTMLWILAIPLFDTTRLLVRRTLRKLSPFKPNNDHLHHLLQAHGFKAWQISLLITFISLVLGLYGILGSHFGLSESWMFVSFILIFILFTAIVSMSWRHLNFNIGSVKE